MSTAERDLARDVVSGVIAFMVTAVAAASAVGFWLSYGNLHDFAVRAGMSGPEAWAFPASIDLFIAAGEAGVTISALRHSRDLPSWCYLAGGVAASVTGNVLHADPSALAWERYAVAAVPPLAAMLALGALLRHVYRLALDAHLSEAVSAPADAPGDVAETHVPGAAEPLPGAHPDEAADAAAPALRSAPPSASDRTRETHPECTRRRPAKRTADAPDARAEYDAELAAGRVPSLRLTMRALNVGSRRAKEVRAQHERDHVDAEADRAPGPHLTIAREG